MSPVRLLWSSPPRYFRKRLQRRRKQKQHPKPIRSRRQNIPMYWNPCEYAYYFSAQFSFISVLHHFQIKRNDGMTTKICQMCFDKINEYDRLRQFYFWNNIHKRFLMELPIEGGETNASVIANPCIGDPDAANQTQSSHNGMSTLKGQMPASQMHTDSSGTES